jgi:hypothetical protein
MAAIDVGSAASNRPAATTQAYTWIDKANPANDTGVIDTIAVYAPASITGLVVGTLYGSGQVWSGRDQESIGAASAGLNSFTGKTLNVQTNDVIGSYTATGTIDKENSGGVDIVWGPGNHLADASYKYPSGGVAHQISVYGTGATEGQPARKRMGGVQFTPFGKGIW